MSHNVTTNIQTLTPLVGDEHKYLCECIDRIKDNPTNPAECNDALRGISNILARCFGMKITTTILDTISDTDFFGINIYPEFKATRAIVDIACGEFIDTEINVTGVKFDNPRSAIEHIWSENDEWHIDFDAKLFYDLSHRFSAREIVALMISRIETAVFSYKIPLTVYKAIKHMMLNVDYRTKTISGSTLCRNFYMIPFMQCCSYVNYPSEPMEGSLFNLIPALNSDYNAALTKLVTYFSSDIVNRPSSDLSQTLKYIIHWIFESVNDLKYHMWFLKKSLEEQINAEKSFYVKNLLISILKQYSVYHGDEITTESYKPEPTKEALALQEKMKIASLEGLLKGSLDRAESKLLDKLGRCKRVSNEEIDILRLEVDKIETVDDKMYYMEKLYDKLTIVNYALSLLEDADVKGKVKDSKDKLEKQKEALMRIREMILAKPIGQERYGLFIKYPAGYEG